MAGTAPAPWNRSVTGGLAALLALWIGAVFLLDRSGALATAAPQAFRPALITVIVPIALFLMAYAASPSLRRFVLAQDLAALTMPQHWRVLDRIRIDRTHIPGSLDPVNPGYTYKVEQIHGP